MSIHDSRSRGPRRRTVITGLAAAVVSPWLLASCLAGDDSGESSHPALRPPTAFGQVTLLDLGDSPRAALTELATRSRRPGQGVNLMVAPGASAFTKLALEQRRPRKLTEMPPFAGDLLLPERTGGDVLVQVEAASVEAVRSATARLLGGIPGLTVRWQSAGHRAGNGVIDGRPVQHNPFGFTEGLGNPDLRHPGGADGPDAVALIGLDSGEPAWVVGGSYLVLRVIQLATQLWDKDTVDTQERVIGRRRDGTWLDGTEASGTPDFAGDPDGRHTPLDSHVRRANPRSRTAVAPRLIRRSWAYDAGAATGGQPDQGLLFMAYQADPATGFELVQRRLPGQALDRYLLTVGGGYFVVPPPDDGGATWVDRLLG